jgi:hypothetical protein
MIQVLTIDYRASKSFTINLLISSFIVMVHILNSCGLDIENPNPPSKPQWVKKSLPSEWPEHGIDADESGGIYLEWLANVEEDIIAYEVYRSTWFDVNDSLGEYKLLSRLETESLSSLAYIDLSAQARIRYYFKLKAYNSSDSPSEFTDSISYKLLAPVSFRTMVPNGIAEVVNVDRYLSWTYSYYLEMENYSITILTQGNHFIARTIIQPVNYFGREEFWQIPTNIELEYGTIYKWRIDTGANYIHGTELTGSESAWAYFIFQN